MRTSINRPFQASKAVIDPLLLFYSKHCSKIVPVALCLQGIAFATSTELRYLSFNVLVKGKGYR
jgi:hypothetical protein